MSNGEIMRWKVNHNSSHRYWFILEMNGAVTLKEFLTDVITRTGSHGSVYIRRGDEAYSLTYAFGTISWTSDEILDRMHDVQVKSGQAHGWHPHIDYHIEVE